MPEQIPPEAIGTKVAGECPMGCGRTLFLGAGGHVTCSLLGCPAPTAATDLLGRGGRPVLDEAEQAVMDHILAAIAGIHAMGLRANAAELAQAVHVLQSFVIQHMLQRLGPGDWGSWYEPMEARHG